MIKVGQATTLATTSSIQSVITHCATLYLLHANEQARDFLKMLWSAHNEILG